MNNTRDLQQQADYQFKQEEQKKMVDKLKQIKRTTYETKKLLVQYAREADVITRQVEKDLQILETM
jgi:hypothetical protein